MSGYIGVLPVPQTTQTRESFTATAGQTSFGTSGYQIDHLDVYLNGVKLAAADFTATNGSDIVLATGAALNDILEMVAFETFTIANQSFTGTTTVDTLVVTNTVDGRDVSVDGAKLDTIPIISTSSTPSFTAKGDGTTDGYIQLNCSQNSHGIKLKSPPHSANASYTLTFPNDDGNAGQFLKTNGSGVLSWATDSTTDSTKLPLAGGAMTGPITTNSTFDGVDVATRDAVLTSTTTTAGAALPKAGGVLTGAVTTNSTFDGRDVATDGTKLDTVETNADVTDATNVTAAGALMDSELTNLAAVKAINQSLVTTASPTFAGLATTANVTFGDSDKAIFGAGSDLQIYHDSNNSYIKDAGDGDLYIQGEANVRITDGDGNKMFLGQNDGEVQIYHNGSERLATKATGVNVTGTVTADGLTVTQTGSTTAKIGATGTSGDNDGTLIINNGGTGDGMLRFDYETATDRARIGVSASDQNLQFFTAGNNERMRIDSSGNVGIGTLAPVQPLHIASSSTSRIQMTNNASGSTSNDGYAIGMEGTTRLYHWLYENSYMLFATNNAERGRFTAAGDFLIGTQSVIDAGAGTQDGFSFSAGDRADFSRNNNPPLDLRRRGNDGAIVNFYKDTTNVGSISANGGSIIVGSGDTGLYFDAGSDRLIPVNPTNATGRDNAVDLGGGSERFKNLFLSGGVHLGGIDTAHKLDDYEEGNWTPRITFGAGGNAGQAYGNQNGKYTKVGRSVHCQYRVTFSDKGSSTGVVKILGLPFTTSGVNSGHYLGYLSNFVGTNIANFTQIWTLDPNSTEIHLRYVNASGNNASITNSDFKDNSDIIANFSYQTDS